MTILNRTTSRSKSGLCRWCAVSLIIMVVCIYSTPTLAQEEIRYSWFEISYIGQDVGRTGTQSDIVLQQTVDVNASDGDGIQFRGSVGTWNNFYVFFDFASSDIDISGVVTNPGGTFPATDEFDFTTIRGGLGYRYPINYRMDIYGELSYDSLDLDFGSFAGENFDNDDQDMGASLGIRGMFGDDLELRAYARFNNVGDVDLSIPASSFESDTLIGVGFGYTLIRGLSITGDYQSGELSSFNLGFRLDLDEG